MDLKGYKIIQKELKLHKKWAKCKVFGPEVPALQRNLGISPSFLNGKSFCPKTLSGIWGGAQPPPPLAETIR